MVVSMVILRRYQDQFSWNQRNQDHRLLFPRRASIIEVVGHCYVLVGSESTIEGIVHWCVLGGRKVYILRINACFLPFLCSVGYFWVFSSHVLRQKICCVILTPPMFKLLSFCVYVFLVPIAHQALYQNAFTKRACGLAMGSILLL